MAAERRTRNEWRDLVDEWQTSGLSRRDFARRAGVNANTLAWWRWKLGASTPAFLEVVVAAPEPPPAFELFIGDIVVRVPLGFDGYELRRLVDALC